VLLDARELVVWESGTSGKAGAVLIVTDNGSVPLLAVTGSVLWSRPTGAER
jgi:hypothetical protein